MIARRQVGNVSAKRRDRLRKEQAAANQGRPPRRETESPPVAGSTLANRYPTGQLRLVGGFFLRLLFWYVLLTLLSRYSPLVKESYAAAFRACARTVFATFHVDGRTEWLPTTEAGEFDTEVRLRNARVPDIEGGTHCDSRRMAYAPLSFIAALVLATPLPWRRRLIALFWGLLAVHLFIVLRLELILLYAFCEDSPARLYAPSPFWSNVLYHAFEALAGSFPSSFIVPTMLWALITFRRGDLERWCSPRPADS